ncbi:hypothetical protein GIB67_010906 [Kingdonia uniflora]|uniref:Transmembrane protein n=1 Tax=Kingdonia uniflora TaxID=39325 RepID=A0A7J7M4R0_9MAGN|nr:hypothetical protein GIB67_010906 [Kingdonia uniflora]
MISRLCVVIFDMIFMVYVLLFFMLSRLWSYFFDVIQVMAIFFYGGGRKRLWWWEVGGGRWEVEVMVVGMRMK